MQAEGVWPNAYTFTSLLNACAQLPDFDLGLYVLHCLAQSGIDFSAEVPYTNMIRACGKALEMDKAFAALSAMLASGAVPSLATFNFLIEHSGKARRPDLASSAFVTLQTYYAPDTITFAAMIGACAWMGQVNEAFNLLREMLTARKLMPPDGLCSIVLGAATRHHLLRTAFATLSFMSPVGACETPSVGEFDALIEACAQMGDEDRAFGALDRMVHARAVPTSRTFRSLITACKGENLLQRMNGTNSRFLPDTANLACALLQACAETTALGCAFELTSYMERSTGDDGDSKERRNLQVELCQTQNLGAINHLLVACIAVGDLDLHATLQSKLAALGVPLEKMLSSGYAPVPLSSTKSLHISFIPLCNNVAASMKFEDMIESPKSVITESLSSSPYDWSTDDYSTC